MVRAGPESYTPDGGKVDLSVTTEEGHAILRIQDLGPGIQVAERKRVFDPFYRTLGSDEVGLGLGLSIVKAVTDRIGAEIQLGFSDEGRHSGLCVSVLVPRIKQIQGIPQKTAIDACSAKTPIEFGVTVVSVKPMNSSKRK